MKFISDHEQQYPDIKNVVLYGYENTPDPTKVVADEVKTIVVGSALMNYVRLTKNFGSLLKPLKKTHGRCFHSCRVTKLLFLPGKT